MVEILAAAASWATPTALFILLNIVIGFIAVTSSLTKPKKQPTTSEYHGAESPYRLTRSPSLFSRVASFNLSSPFSSMTTAPASYDYNNHRSNSTEYYPEERPLAPASPMTPQVVKQEHSYSPVTAVDRSPSFLSRVASFNFSITRSAQIEQPAPAVAEVVEEPTRRMKNKDQLLLRNADSDAAEMAKKKKTTMTMTTTTTRTPPHEAKGMENKNKKKEKLKEKEVDAKADDFINSFKQQLRLQKLESIIRNRNAPQS